MCARNCLPRCCSASKVRAKIIKPLVSRSSRCTARNRRGKPWEASFPFRPPFFGSGFFRWGGLPGCSPAAGSFFCRMRGRTSSSVGCNCLRRPEMLRSSECRSVVIPAGFSTTTTCGSANRTRTSCSFGGATVGCSSTLITSPGRSRRPSSRLRFPLMVTRRELISFFTSFHDQPGSHLRRAADTVKLACSGATWNCPVVFLGIRC